MNISQQDDTRNNQVPGEGIHVDKEEQVHVVRESDRIEAPVNGISLTAMILWLSYRQSMAWAKSH